MINSKASSHIENSKKKMVCKSMKYFPSFKFEVQKACALSSSKQEVGQFAEGPEQPVDIESIAHAEVPVLDKQTLLPVIDLALHVVGDPALTGDTLRASSRAELLAQRQGDIGLLIAYVEGVAEDCAG